MKNLVFIVVVSFCFLALLVEAKRKFISKAHAETTEVCSDPEYVLNRQTGAYITTKYVVGGFYGNYTQVHFF